MFISRDHFLQRFTVALAADGRPVTRLIAVDTDLMVAQRLVGYNPETGKEVTDLVKVDRVVFISNGMPEGITDLIPEGFEVVEAKVSDPQDTEEQG